MRPNALDVSVKVDWVSILVLMEVSCETFIICYNHTTIEVSILVLMEVSCETLKALLYLKLEKSVSILVLMEVSCETKYRLLLDKKR